jgi:hypothetical protein
MNRRYLGTSVSVCIRVLSTLRRGWNQQAPSDEPTVHFVDAPDEL